MEHPIDVEVAEVFDEPAELVWRLALDMHNAPPDVVKYWTAAEEDGRLVHTIHLSDEVWIRQSRDEVDEATMTVRGSMVESKGLPLTDYRIVSRVEPLDENSCRAILRCTAKTSDDAGAVSGMIRGMFALLLTSLREAVTQQAKS